MNTLLQNFVDECKKRETIPSFMVTLRKMYDEVCKIEIPDGKGANSIIDNHIISNIDEKLSLRPKIKHVKYCSVSEALKSNNIYGVMVSINNACYIFENMDRYNDFRERFVQCTLYDMSNLLDKINVYHITHADVLQKARLVYVSKSDKEINEVVHRLAELSGTSVDSILTYKLDKEYKIVLSEKIGTWDQVSVAMSKYNADLKKSGLNGAKLYEKMEVGDSICPAEHLEIGKNGPIIVYHYTIEQKINIANGDHINMIIGNDNTTNITKIVEKPPKKTDEEIATEWISKNTYSIKNTRAEYHEKYVDCMDKDDNGHISIRRFAKIMRNLGYKEDRIKEKRVWVKVNKKTDDSDEE